MLQRLSHVNALDWIGDSNSAGDQDGLACLWWTLCFFSQPPIRSKHSPDDPLFLSVRTARFAQAVLMQELEDVVGKAGEPIEVYLSIIAAGASDNLRDECRCSISTLQTELAQQNDPTEPSLCS